MGGLWRRPWAVAIFALLVTATISLQAQELRDRDRNISAGQRIAEDLRKARMHYGPFYLLSSIQLADIGYDQQYFIPTADTSSGFSFGLSMPNRLYFTPNRKVYLSVDASPQWSRFRGADFRQQWGFKSRGDAQLLLNHLYLDAYVVRNNELHADTAEISSLLTRRSEEVGVTGELKYSSRTSLTYSALAQSLRFPLGSKNFQPDLPVELLDRNEHSYRTALVHKTFPLSSLILAAEYSGYSFPSAVYKNSHRTYGGAGFDYESGRSGVRLEAGLAKLNFLRPDRHDFRGGVGTLTIDHELTESWRVAAGGARDLVFSIFADNDYYLANRGTLSTDVVLTRRLSLTGGYTLVYDDYQTPTTGSKKGGVVRRRDRMSFPYLGWTYSSPHHFRGGFDVGYLKRTSNFPINEFAGIRVIVHLSFTP